MIMESMRERSLVGRGSETHVNPFLNKSVEKGID
jgi:hypothetical protein